MGFLGKLRRGSKAFLGKVENTGKNIINKSKDVINKVEKVGGQIANKADDALKIGGKIMSGLGTAANIVAMSGIPGVSELAMAAAPSLKSGGKMLIKGGKVIDKFNDKRAQLSDMKQKVFSTANKINHEVLNNNGSGSYNNNQLNQELPGLAFDG